MPSQPFTDDPDNALTWPLAAYGCVIRGDETTPEDQLATAQDEAIAERMVLCWNLCVGIPTRELARIQRLGASAEDDPILDAGGVCVT